MSDAGPESIPDERPGELVVVAGFAIAGPSGRIDMLDGILNKLLSKSGFTLE
jgi:hypothetical protein